MIRRRLLNRSVLFLAALIAAGGVADAQDKDLPVGQVITAVGSSVARTTQLLEKAKKEKDVVRVNCILDKLTALQGLFKVAEISAASLVEAGAAKDAEATKYERDKLDLAVSKARQLSGQAERCVGEISRYTGPIEVEVEIDPALAGLGSAVELNQYTAPELTRPNSASPYQ